MKLLFGTAGIPLSTKGSTSIDGIEQVKKLGLDCMEMEFVRGIKMGIKTAEKVGIASKEFGILLTIHAPYYINLNSKDKTKLKASKNRIIKSAQLGKIFNAHSVVFHPGYYMGKEPKEVYKKIKEAIKEIRSELNKNKNSVILSPETMGRSMAFGTFEELVQLSKEIKGVQPCIDFAHLYARSNGKMNSRKEFDYVFKTIEKELGKKALKQLHMHVSGIQFNEKGEQHHLNLNMTNYKYKDLLKSMKHYGVGGILICESPNIEKDAMMLKIYYNKI